MKGNIQDFIQNKMSSEAEDELLRTLHTQNLKKEQLKKWRAAQNKSTIKLLLQSKSIRAIAAACILLVVSITYWKLTISYPPQYQEVITDCLQDIPKLSTIQMGTTENVIAFRRQAEMAYSAQKFEEAKDLYLKVIESEKLAVPTDYFYLGVCYMHVTPSQYEQAIESFRKLRSLDKGFKQQEVTYQLGLCYASLKQFKDARQELLPIRDVNGLSEKIEKLLKVLPK